MYGNVLTLHRNMFDYLIDKKGISDAGDVKRVCTLLGFDLVMSLELIAILEPDGTTTVLKCRKGTATEANLSSVAFQKLLKEYHETGYTSASDELSTVKKY